jgi:hypothetical protein
MFNQYGSNLTKMGDIFPLVAKILTPTLASPQRQAPDVLSDSEHPPLSLSRMSDTPDGSKSSGQSYLTPGKAIRLSDVER